LKVYKILGKTLAEDRCCENAAAVFLFDMRQFSDYNNLVNFEAVV